MAPFKLPASSARRPAILCLHWATASSLRSNPIHVSKSARLHLALHRCDRDAGSRGGSSRVARNRVAQQSFSRGKRHVRREFHSTTARIGAAATVAAGHAMTGAAARRRLRIGSAGRTVARRLHAGGGAGRHLPGQARHDRHRAAIPRRPVRPAGDPQSALEAAAAGDALGRHAGRDTLRQPLSAGILALRQHDADRGLPVPQRVYPQQGRRSRFWGQRRAPGDGVDLAPRLRQSIYRASSAPLVVDQQAYEGGEGKIPIKACLMRPDRRAI
jgi:murein DD-endopeptidase MepM/ murein hydrolase activator NlpD